MSEAARPQWEQSVEKARLAGMKTFEGRLEIARASFEQIPPNGRGVAHGQTLAKFAADAGLEYAALAQYRDITKWWGDLAPQSKISWTTVREAKATGKWRNGAAFITFTLKTDPPEPFGTWTMDALRVHLNRKPTNTGRVALALAAGENVSEDEQHKAAALDHAEEAAEEIEEIKAPLTAALAASEAAGVVESAVPETGQEIRALEEGFRHLDLLGDIANGTGLLEAQLARVPDWLARYGQQNFDGETGAELMLSSLTEKKGRLDLAFSKAGVGSDIESDFAALLDKEV